MRSASSCSSPAALTTFSIANDIAKYFAIIPAMFMMVIPQCGAEHHEAGLSHQRHSVRSDLQRHHHPCLIPLAMRGVKYKPMSASKMLTRNMLIYGLGGVIVPFIIGIKVIDLIAADDARPRHGNVTGGNRT